MFERLFQNPLAAFGFLFIVFCLVLVYFANRERAKVAQMRGPKRFSPSWSSGRKHRRKSFSSQARGGGFTPRWNREESGESHDAPRDSHSAAGSGTEAGPESGADQLRPGKE